MRSVGKQRKFPLNWRRYYTWSIFLGNKLIGSIKGLSKDEEFDIKKSLRRIFTYVLLRKREWWRFRDEYLFSKGVLVVKDSYQTLIQKKVVNTLKTSFKHIFLQK